MSLKRALLIAGSGLLVAGAVQRARAGCRSSTEWPRGVDDLARDAPGRLRGAAYRLRGRHPDSDVDDRTLEDRIRSSIGPVTRRLDLPHVHVMVHHGVATLHGDVATHADAEQVIDAVLDVWGVQGVDTHLHVGLLASDTRPSEGRDQSHPSSPALDRLLAAAAAAGANAATLFVVRAVLGTLLATIPSGERRHVLAHLPHDVRLVAGQPWRRYIRRSEPPDPMRELRQAVRAADPRLSSHSVDAVIDALFAALAELVPEERHDIAAVLPADLRDRWVTASGSTETADDLVNT